MRGRRGNRQLALVGRCQVPQPALMSYHYPVNTAMHVVSDQLGSHKGKTGAQPGAQIDSWLHLGHCLSLTAECGWPTQGGRSGRGWGVGEQFHSAPSNGCQAEPAANKAISESSIFSMSFIWSKHRL